MLEVLNIFFVFLLVIANGFFVASEFALVGVRRSRITALAKSGDKRAQRLEGLVGNLNAYISATQLGITLASLALGWIGEPAIAHLLEIPLKGRVSDAVLDTLAFTIAFSIITFLHIVIGELAPKTIALERAEKTALAIALPMQIFYKLFSWPIRLLDWAGTRTVRSLGLRSSNEHASIYTEEELLQLIDASRQSGHLKEEQQQMINSVFAFASAEVHEAMIPRTAVDAIPLAASLAETKTAFRTLGYSRLPVYRERLDDIVGVLFRRDLEPYLENPAQAEEFKLEKLLRPPQFIPATMRLGAALRLMQESHAHLSIVLDEYGGMEGIVTLEDLLEEIVGEINDEYDGEVRSQISKEAGGTYLLSGMLTIRDANRQLNLNLPEDAGYRTLAGFMQAEAGRLLQQDETVEYQGLRFKVERLDRRRIRRIRLTPTATDNQLPVSAIVTFIITVLIEPLLNLHVHPLI